MSNAPKVTIEEVEASIKSETYTILPDGRTTICQLTLDNGFTVTGDSACVSPENFNKEEGEHYARKQAVDGVWEFLGFRLADKLHRQTERRSLKRRMLDEQAELAIKVELLEDFLIGRNFSSLGSLSAQKMNLLHKQLPAMKLYLGILEERIALMEFEEKNQKVGN